MNIDQAKALDINQLLQQLGHQPTRRTAKDTWYVRPYGQEKHASFHVSADGRGWFDFGTGQGGSIIDLALLLSGCSDVKQALSWLDDVTAQRVRQAPLIPVASQRQPLAPESPAYTLVEARPYSVYGPGSALTKASLYLGSRGVHAERVAPYLHDVIYQGYDGKNRYGFGVLNVSGGYEIRRSGDWQKRSVGSKDVSMFQASRTSAPWHCFYSMIDFCTFITLDKPPIGAYHYLIVNSDSLVNKAADHLADLPAGYMLHYPHQDASGQQAYRKLLELTRGMGWEGSERSQLYTGYKDWTEAREQQLGLSSTQVKPTR